MIYKIDTVDSDDKICQLEKLARKSGISILFR